MFGVDITRSWVEAELGEGEPSRSELTRQVCEALRGAGISSERREEVISAFEIGDITVAS